MSYLRALHEEFIDKARRPMSFGSLPVSPQEPEVPLIAVNKWTKVDGTLLKKYYFRTKEMRNQFIGDVLDHEGEVGHHADITIAEDSVSIRLQTKDIEQITELDKEFAKWADTTYKDVCYGMKEDRDAR